MKVVLTGYRGTGKTVVGRVLSRHLDLPFHDTDTLIEEEAAVSIPEIFAQEGEAGFRGRERRVIAGLHDADGVISVGGGAVMDPENVSHLRAHATVFLLTADADTIGARISGSDRPSLTGLPPAEEIRRLLAKRREAYLASADFCLDTSTASPVEVAESIQDILEDGCPDSDARARSFPLIERMPLPAGDSDRIHRLLHGGREGRTRICAIVGDPCLHSRSPAIHNTLFWRFHLPFYYTAFQWSDPGILVDLMRRFDIRGFSVTIPHKQAIIPSLDEVSADASRIGAVNTVVQCGGRCRGENTDWIGVRAPVAHLRGARALILGAGGAAAAAAHALCDLEMDVTIMNRTHGHARVMAERFGCRTLPWGSMDGVYDLVVNATPLGMGGEGIPLSPEVLVPETTVFDLVYTPPDTPLIRAAREHGCATITGTELFIHQAAAQFRLFTGIEVDAESVRGVMP